jgi:hypothetical protein
LVVIAAVLSWRAALVKRAVATGRAPRRSPLMQLSPVYRAARHRDNVRDSLKLAMKADDERALALLIDTAIESRRCEQQAQQEADRQPPTQQ